MNNSQSWKPKHRDGLTLMHVLIGRVDTATSLADRLKCSVPTARKSLNGLVSLGLLLKVEFAHRSNVVGYSYKISPDVNTDEVLLIIRNSTGISIDLPSLWDRG